MVRSKDGRKFILLTVCLWAFSNASAVGAQHLDILYGTDDGHVKTGATNFDTLSLVPDVRVFSNTFSFNAGQGGLWTDDPGHTSNDAPPGMSALPGNADLSFRIAVEPLTGRNLSYWDGDTYPISWGPVPGSESIEVSFGANLAVADGGTQPAPGFLIDTEPPVGGIHLHLDYHLRPTGSAAGGVYLLALEAEIDPALPADVASPSPRFWIVFRYNESATDWNAAVQWVEANLDVPDCQDGFDNDGDGLVDLAGDPGCDSSSDESESSLALVCDDGLDNDLDGMVDMADLGCASPTSSTESPECQDGIDNDGALGTDFDGGVSVLGAGNGDPNGADPQCTSASLNKEAAGSPVGCGLGPEIAVVLGLLLTVRRRMVRT